MTRHDAFVGLGANLGTPDRTIEQALDALRALPATRLVARSSLYRTAPQGYADQPAFVNAVARLDTALAALELLDALLAIEARFGRERSFRNAPRTLDLDLLLFDALVIDTPRLTLPHPRMHERAFVLVPLLELDPAIEIPRHGSAAALAATLGDQGVRKL